MLLCLTCVARLTLLRRPAIDLAARRRRHTFTVKNGILRRVESSSLDLSGLRGRLEADAIDHKESTFAPAAEPRLAILKDDSQTLFHGVQIPIKPRPPKDDECCMSGCARCVYDLYAEDLSDYSDACKKAQVQLTELQVPQSQWPSSLPRMQAAGAAEPPSDLSPTLSAFMLLEKKLASKQSPASTG
ncbi:uncharacterized protein L969DRAFT_90348 [Mixia osmundae IAM 14324]|uniref:Oxidoreductase-like domain-containing protein n=1 Tax=Mixia osmundae (strain CBS 9802 / IAM 14324 / JCM 22182 / KY 12970) TaxID=764103 RepID=G7E284_MIXOS|nr:uncharacterized protein L969DRAFT_90348 [Mixia osmundae IAM 14324]KEI36816.1 hypothetical protein L969DRAFT_90348 [Mixia osmundae IAM 14324]GAA96944.1 hypothetical protein E5Q_03618 [Mixia osmundae IAM 14324]